MAFWSDGGQIFPHILVAKACGSPCKKAATRLYCLKQLKRAKVPPKDMLLFYTTCIHPVLEYACPVFHHSLLQYLSNEMERLQKRALRIKQPDLG